MKADMKMMFRELMASAMVMVIPALIVISVTYTSLSLTGCATTGPHQSQMSIERTAAIVRMSAQLGTYYAVKEEPEAQKWFMSAQTILTVLIRDKVLTPEQVRAALIGLDAENQDLIVPVMAALNIYDVFFADVTRQNLDKVTYLVPVLTALRDGIALGLNLPATKSMHGIK